VNPELPATPGDLAEADEAEDRKLAGAIYYRRLELGEGDLRLLRNMLIRARKYTLDSSESWTIKYRARVRQCNRLLKTLEEK